MLDDQPEFSPPTEPNQKRKAENLIPRFYRSDANNKFISGTINQLIQNGTVRRLNGYIGRENSKATSANDIFLTEPLLDRKNYQLEPSLVIEDSLGNVAFFKDYLDYINTIDVLGGITNNHERLNQQEFYSWEPHINWDKFVNFSHYYWLPSGPDTITIPGQQQNIISTYTVTLSDEVDHKVFLFTPNGLTRNPSLTLYRGQTYRFEINSPNEPFSIKTLGEKDSLFRFIDGITGYGLTGPAVENGVVTFTVPMSCPNVLFYVSENTPDASGIINIYDITENTVIDVENEIINKQTYTLSSGLSLSNGMKVNFKGYVTPSFYGEGDFYVEGVGNKIQLISEKQLEIIAPYTTEYDVTFDDTGYDKLSYNDVKYSPIVKDYITINRSSMDRNPWSRYNRWFHESIIEKTANELGQVPVFDQAQRAKRPIIEFNANLKLFNFGITPKKDIDLVDDFTNDVFSIIEGSLGYNIDNVQLVDGYRILFTGDKDPLVYGKIYRVKFTIIHDNNTNVGERRIHLEEEPDSIPSLHDVVLVRTGIKYTAQMLWYDGIKWIVGQTKTTQNQQPLFDLFDEEGISLNDPSKYDGSSFLGNKIFSYKIGTGVKDKELGFALSYKNINNVGDILFNFDLLQNSFSYRELSEVIVENTNNKFVKKVGRLGTEYLNGWTKNKLKNVQPIIRIYKNSGLVNDFTIDVYDDKTDLDDLLVKVYINGKRLDKHLFSIIDSPVYKKVILNNDVTDLDIVTLRCYSKQCKNSNGKYEFPINFQNNPLNNDINDFTLGEVIDHVDSIIDNINSFEGAYPGVSNLRDLTDVSSYGTKFVQHSGSINVSLYHLTNKDINIIDAIEKSRDDYSKFKRNFISNLLTVSNNLSVKDSIDSLLFEINENKPKTAPYYFSDVLSYGAYRKTDFTIEDYRIKEYPLYAPFTLDNLNYKSVNVYLNDLQLIHEKDYVFGFNGFVKILAELKENDILTVYEYESTDGCYIPATPTILGLYPKFVPKKYLDTTLIQPQNVIQGHDGSIILAYDDYRDDLILELEKRIFNNIKIRYDEKILDIYDFIPGANRKTQYSIDEFNKILGNGFFKWTSLIDKDFTKSSNYDSLNAFTFNYSQAVGVDGSSIPAFWRGIYKFYFDTDRIHLTPWESLGFSIKPKWWEDVYGPAPYTANNLILWHDLRDGVIREPNKPILRNPKFARPVLDNIPVDELGNLLDPVMSNLSQGVFDANSNSNYIFGDQGPVETAWRRSSYYPFSLIITMILMQPNQVLGCYLDRSRIFRNKNDQFVYKNTNLRLRLSDIVTPNTVKDTKRSFTAGLINYVVDYIQGDNSISLDTYKSNLKTINNKLSHRLAGFTSKEKYQLILDSKNASAKSGVFVPNENYKIFLNSSSPIKKLSYSGVIVNKIKTKQGIGYVIKGYNQNNPYFYYYNWTQPGFNINVGGISESYIQWTPNQQYIVGSIVDINNQYYRVKISHASQDNPSYDLLQKLSELPIVGGVVANLRKKWEREPVILNYGTILNSIQEVVDFLQGHGEYLKDQGFSFDNFNPDLRNVASWDVSIKEFLFWTTQNWSSGGENYVDWNEGTAYKLGEIVLYNGEYYRSKQDQLPSEFFDPTSYFKLDELNSDGAAAISLSPAALQLDLNLQYTTVDDLRENNNYYEIFSADGKKYDPSFLNYIRYNNIFSLKPKNENLGIYGATLYLVQKEHVLLIDNLTQFNDVIYSPETGYRQEKIQIAGYKTINWNGSLDAPGFIYDRAAINDWVPWQDYHLGDIVKYKEFYYSASKFLPGIETFDKNNWIKLTKKPTSQLLPNWDYKALQFVDFYDLDSDNFDIGQQKMAQHLIGYQKRQYLENIIKNDVSEFKFYQGMIQEKGSINSLNKLFDVLSAENKDSIDFIEEWALRVGQYGAKDAFDEVEFILDESEFKNNSQSIELVSSIDNNLVDFIIRQTKNDVYLKPKNYRNDLWETNNNYIPFLRTPGFVKKDQVKFNTDKLEDLLNENPLNFESGDYIWSAFEPKLNEFNDDWNVHRFTHTPHVINNITFTDSNKDLTIVLDHPCNFNVDDLIAITSNYEKLNIFCKIKSLSTDYKTIVVATNLDSYTPRNPNLSAKLFTLAKQRFQTIDDLIVPYYLKNNELAWVDKSTNGKHAIWRNVPVYNSNKISYSFFEDSARFGKTLAVNKSADYLAALGGQNELIIYYKPTSNWKVLQALTANASLVEFATSVSFSDDGKWLAISSKKADNNGVVILFSLDTLNNVYVFSTQIINPERVLRPDPYFGYKTKFAYDGNYSLTISSTNGLNISGIIYYYKHIEDSTANWQCLDIIKPSDVNCSNQPFAYDFDVDQTAKTLAISTSLIYGQHGKVLILQREGDQFDKDQSMVHQIENLNQTKFGQVISLSERGTYLAASGLQNNSSQQAVSIYKNYELLQTLTDRNSQLDTNEQFGTYIKFVNNEKTLIVYNKLGDSSKKKLFNYDDSTVNYDDSTTYDDSTYINLDSGRVDVYDRYENKFIYAESLSVETDGVDRYGDQVVAADNQIFVSAPNALNSVGKRSGIVFNYFRNDYSWKPFEQESPKIDISLFKKIFLYNKRTNELLTYLDILDINQGKILRQAENEIKYKTYYDPATYSYKKITSSFDVDVDDGMAWLEQQVGTLWWDLRRAKFLDAHIGDIVYKNNTWNTLYDTASIDIYEWVESKIPPADWDSTSSTADGITQGITGTSLYGDSVYSIKKNYDTISKRFTSLYYFWVKNKITVPNVNGRTNSALEIASTIVNPKGQGLKYIEFTNTNSISLTNIKPLLTAKDVVLSIQYWLPNIDRNTNIHSEWKIISENEKTEIPKQLERKWIDSLVGFDETGKMVPDISLSPKQRYGIEFKPRQSMFINRIEAIKQVIERFNSEFKKIQIDNIDLTDLLKKDLPPSEIYGLYDYVIDTEKELRFVNVNAFKKARLSLNIENGKIVAVSVLDGGYGYQFSPPITISGDGIGTQVKAVLGLDGSIARVDVLSTGEGYNKLNSTVSLRALTVLVRSDSTAFNNWVIYAYDTNTEKWSKIKIQEYDVTAFWNYIDWYAEGYNQFSKIDYAVDSTYQLYTHDSQIGQIVKVNNVGNFGWLLLKKYSNIESIDYTKNFQVIGRQNGSIQLSNKFYNLKNNRIGYDGTLYDINKFDNSGSAELRTILNSLKDKILIDNRRILYLNLFFLSIRYALSEQPFIDWVFKTSFVKALHNVGPLKQKITYSNDNLEDYENYIAEVKPYRTKIREFVSVYNDLDNTQSLVTDFDLPSFVSLEEIKTIQTTVKNELSYFDSVLDVYPWRLWKENFTFSIKEILIFDSGSKYLSRPSVKIIGDCTTPATARAFVSTGRIVKIEVLSGGSGYYRAPTIILDEHLDVGGVQARAIAVIKNDLVRSNSVAIKFDRYTKEPIENISPLKVTELFQATGSTIEYDLKYSPNTEYGKISVQKVNMITLSSNDYTIVEYVNQSSAYGKIIFKNPPSSGYKIVINYKNNLTDYNEIFLSNGSKLEYDIKFKPISVQIINNAIDVIADDYTIVRATKQSEDNSHTIHYGKIIFKIRIASEFTIVINYEKDFNHLKALDRITHYYNPESGMIGRDFAQLMSGIDYGGVSIVGINFDPPESWDSENNTWDSKPWDSDNVNDAYDTLIQGGKFGKNNNTPYVTASGLAAEDIIIDGDEFINVMTSPAPEEMIPGHVADTLVIKVSESSSSSTSAEVVCDSYISDGELSEYKLTTYPNSKSAVIVKVGSELLNLDEDYLIDFDNLMVKFLSIPPQGKIISFIILGFNGSNVLDIGHQLIEVPTKELLLDFNWRDNLDVLVLVSGELVNVSKIQTDSSYTIKNKLAIRFTDIIQPGQLVNYVIFDSLRDTSIVTRETIITDGTTLRYTLLNPVGKADPLTQNTIVRIGNEILNSTDSFSFVLQNNQYSYQIPIGKGSTNDVDVYNINFDYKIYIDNVLVQLGNAYTIDLITEKINIKPNFYVENARVLVVIVKYLDYEIALDAQSNTNYIEFKAAYPDNTRIEVIAMYNHDVLNMSRRDYKVYPNIENYKNSIYYLETIKIGSGILTLMDPVIDASYVWVIKNKNLLISNVDYTLSDNKKEVILNTAPLASDKFSVITFGGNVFKEPIAFMQFKDILNRVHYKRISKNRTTRLAKELKFSDKEIVVEDPTTLGEPNIALNQPGAIYINGERIEYFIKDKNTLSQLRRGTWGTGIPTLHLLAAEILDIGVGETVPYEDTVEILDWAPNIKLPYTPNKDGIEVFVGGIRQRKNSYELHNPAIHPESPNGDVKYSADFTVDSVASTVRLNTTPRLGIRTQVVRKTLNLWNDPGKDIANSSNSIAYFLKFNPKKLGKG